MFFDSVFVKGMYVLSPYFRNFLINDQRYQFGIFNKVVKLKVLCNIAADSYLLSFIGCAKNTPKKRNLYGKTCFYRFLHFSRYWKMIETYNLHRIMENVQHYNFVKDTNTLSLVNTSKIAKETYILLTIFKSIKKHTCFYVSTIVMYLYN